MRYDVFYRTSEGMQVVLFDSPVRLTELEINQRARLAGAPPHGVFEIQNDDGLYRCRANGTWCFLAWDAVEAEGAEAVRQVGLVSCAQVKLDSECEAHRLYVSDLFRKALAYALATCDEVFVLSALHGVVPLDQVVAPYDVTLAKMTRAERTRWGCLVARQLDAMRLAGSAYVALAGDKYVAPLREQGFEVVEPLAGLEVGERKQWLKNNTKEVV